MAMELEVHRSWLSDQLYRNHIEGPIMELSFNKYVHN